MYFIARNIKEKRNNISVANQRNIKYLEELNKTTNTIESGIADYETLIKDLNEKKGQELLEGINGQTV